MCTTRCRHESAPQRVSAAALVLESREQARVPDVEAVVTIRACCRQSGLGSGWRRASSPLTGTKGNSRRVDAVSRGIEEPRIWAGVEELRSVTQKAAPLQFMAVSISLVNEMQRTDRGETDRKEMDGPSREGQTLISQHRFTR
jgi:hypothetical protein